MWVKLGDEFVDDAADLPDAAVRTFIEMLAWSNRRGLDLIVPKRDLRRFAFSENAEEAIAELISTGWLISDEHTWQIVYRPEWQKTAQWVETRRANNRRYQAHRRDDHRWCSRENCQAVSGADKDADSARDPGRVGSGRDGLLTEPTTEDDGCVTCGTRAPLDDSRQCQRCATAWSATA
jgi:hypothetical protein